MSIASLSALTDAEVAELRAAHPGAFGSAGAQLRRWGPWALALAYLVWSLWFFEIGRFLDASGRVWVLLTNFVVWEDMATWSYGAIYLGIAQTLAMAFLGTLLGTLGALVLGFLAARNVTPVWLLRQAVRRLLDVLRGIDQLVWGLVFVRAVGLGPLAGVLAIFVSDLGTLSKLYAEAIENIDRKQVEGVRATGAGPLSVIRFGVVPQVLPVFISQSLYFLESNTRSATILGIVGAGGIGMIIIERFRAQLYDQVAFVVLNVLVLIFAIDWLSRRVRLWAIGERHHP
ncbi:phosphonate ABC transporter, permease protein PhnE [Roseicyclus persicicus]|uniref:Phosphonate ABC transporter, permease protein PhnE n=1 Tax=Roseicyclus persicicus TaxID=2650661 RepID=A0A7X6JYR9_9RHOB|nr:phosphonate ABC transporter, permease protein PhnE [Roseibacterium persicicum]NKX44789.1 phosphonate ABC transporter, permease protein PhnE [Roseibacterium persicicum]